MRKYLLAGVGGVLLGVVLAAPGVRAHHPLLSGEALCRDNGWAVTWTAEPDAVRGLQWSIPGYGAGPDSTPLTRTVTYPQAQASASESESVTATWSNGNTASATATVSRPANCGTTTTTTAAPTTTTLPPNGPPVTPPTTIVQIGQPQPGRAPIEPPAPAGPPPPPVTLAWYLCPDGTLILASETCPAVAVGVPPVPSAPPVSLAPPVLTPAVAPAGLPATGIEADTALWGALAVAVGFGLVLIARRRPA